MKYFVELILKIPIFFSYFKYVFQYFYIYLSKFYMPSAHYDSGCCKSFVRQIRGKARCSSPSKTWYKISRKTASEDIGRNSYHRSGIEHSINSAFAVVSHHKSAKLKPSFLETLALVTP